MNTERKRKIKSALLVLITLIGLYLLTNTNNNPNAIIQRVFRPIHIGTSTTLYYAAVIPILLIYYSLKELYKQNDYAFVSTRFKRFIIIMLVLLILPTCLQTGIKLYKSFCSDLSSVYCYRDSMDLSVKTVENERQVVCKLELENCSSKTQQCYVKINLPSFLKEMIESNLKNKVNKDTLLILQAHERRRFDITFSESIVNNGSYFSTGTDNFEFSLYNASQEVKFTQRDYP